MTEEINLQLDDNHLYRGIFANISRDMLHRLQENNYIKHAIIQFFPKKITGRIVIDALTDDHVYDVDIYVNLKATQEIKDTVKKWRNNDIAINNSGELEIHFSIEQKSPIITKDTVNEISLCL